MEVSRLGPTVHVNLDRVGHWVTDVVVGGLARQNGVEVGALQVLDEERVDRLPSLLLLVAPVNQRVFSPPVQLGRRRPCRGRQLFICSGPGGAVRAFTVSQETTILPIIEAQ